jgi:hypothetical protein
MSSMLSNLTTLAADAAQTAPGSGSLIDFAKAQLPTLLTIP